jgi:hypothetical protein
MAVLFNDVQAGTRLAPAHCILYVLQGLQPGDRRNDSELNISENPRPPLLHHIHSRQFACIRGPLNVTFCPVRHD